MSLGKYIKEVRLSRGLSQWELSRLSGLGRSHISRLELDDYQHPSAETFLALAKALKVHPNELYEAAGYEGSSRFRRGPPETAEQALAKLEIITPISVPVVSRINLRKPDVVQYAPWGHSDNGSQNVKGLLVRGFSLEPEVREGDVIFIDSEMTPSPGNIVLCYQDEEVRLVRRDNASSDGESAHGDCHVYGVVIGINRKLA